MMVCIYDWLQLVVVPGHRSRKRPVSLSDMLLTPAEPARMHSGCSMYSKIRFEAVLSTANDHEQCKTNEPVPVNCPHDVPRLRNDIPQLRNSKPEVSPKIPVKSLKSKLERFWFPRGIAAFQYLFFVF